VDELLQAMLSRGGPVDLQEAFSLPLAFKVIYQILGIPFEVSCVQGWRAWRV
jgi:nitric oxide reductase